MSLSIAERIEYQDLIYRLQPRRLDWLKLPKVSPAKKKIKILIVRNSTFETVAAAADALLAYQGLAVEWIYTSYDHSFPEIEMLVVQHKPDGVLFWVDWNFAKSMTETDLSLFIGKMISRTESVFRNKILGHLWSSISPINAKLAHAKKNTEQWIWADIEAMAQLAQVPWQGNATAQSVGSAFSKEFELVFARFVAMSFVPALAGQALRGIILDLDNTMYGGVLGEDGIENLKVTSAHRALWDSLKQFHQAGGLLAVSSKNDHDDVLKMLVQLKMPLQADDFVMIKADWNSKVQNIQEILQRFNFGSEYVLFIDDNPNELISVGSFFPEMNIIKASENGAPTLLALQNFPGFQKISVDSAADVRSQDIKANAQREELMAKLSHSQTDYLAQLELKAVISVNKEEQKNRVADLAQKTNQFNLTFQRSQASDVDKVTQQGGRYYTLSLADRFSDSGVVGAAVVSVQGSEARIEEFLFSCRALGRKAETLFLEKIVEHLLRDQIQTLHVKVLKGPKNQPALDWLSQLEMTVGEYTFEIKKLQERCQKVLGKYPVELTWS